MLPQRVLKVFYLIADGGMQLLGLFKKSRRLILRCLAHSEDTGYGPFGTLKALNPGRNIIVATMIVLK